jgi:hypothetical protein
MSASQFDGFGFDFEHVEPAMSDGIVQYVLEMKAAFPELYLLFYVGVFPGKVGWLYGARVFWGRFTLEDCNSLHLLLHSRMRLIGSHRLPA